MCLDTLILLSNRLSEMYPNSPKSEVLKLTLNGLKKGLRLIPTRSDFVEYRDVIGQTTISGSKKVTVCPRTFIFTGVRLS